VPLCLPTWLPKAPQNPTNSIKSQPKHKKEDFLKMSTSPIRNTPFRWSRIPKPFPKSSKNAPKVPQKSHRFLHRFLDCFFIDFGSFWGPLDSLWAPKSLKRGRPRKKPRGPGANCVPKAPKDASRLPKSFEKITIYTPRTSKMMPKGCQTGPPNPHHETKTASNLAFPETDLETKGVPLLEFGSHVGSQGHPK